jgi:hypothetical protein
MADILKRTSFGLIRTNPKLTTNIKIVADSKNHVYLESIDADPLLSKSIYKGFEVTGGSYSRDLNRFYSQGAGLLPKSIAYLVKEKDQSTQIKDRYKDQYDFDYDMGMYPKNSRIYTEEFAMFFPLWVEQDNIPDYFVIFKMDGPVTVNANEFLKANPGADLDTSQALEDEVSDYNEFFNNYIKKAKIIKTFDLTEKTFIGRYIRDHANSNLFPESSIYASLEKGQLTYFNGISYNEGGFTKKGQDIYADYVLVDKTITESDDFISMGFFNNDVVHPNILNLEFLFDDAEQIDYKFSRYFGLYMSSSELGKFEIDGNRLFKDREVEATQLPLPSRNIVGFANNIESQVQENSKGIKIYPKLGGTGGTSIYQGRLLTYSEIQNPRFPFVKDVKGTLYSINQNTPWDSTYIDGATSVYTDTSFIRIKDTKVDWKNFSGFDLPFTYIPARETDFKGRPNFSFRIVDVVSPGDQIRVGLTDWNDPIQAQTIDFHTITADAGLSPGQTNGLLFSCIGTNIQVASAIAKAINYIQTATNEHQIFEAISIFDRVIVSSRLLSENWNKVRYSLFSTAIDFPFSKPDEFQEIVNQSYLPSPVSLSTSIIGNFFEYHFTGGCDNPKARFVINQEDFQEFKDQNDPVYIRSSKGFELPGDYSLYLDEPVKDSLGRIIDYKNIDKYYVYQLNDNRFDVEFTSSKSVALYKTAKNSNGYLNIFPVRDFDFDFLDTTYMKDADSSSTLFYDWYTGGSTSSLYPTFVYSDLSAQGKSFIDNLIGPTSSFVTSGGFQSINGISNDFLDENSKVTNEYDRLKENVLPEIALSSRVVPFINKWVYDNESTDVRENPYRLNTDQAFTYSNFSPSFDELSPNPKFFTHEWYYLQKYPPYMSFDEKKNSFSYFDEDLYFPTLPAIGSAGSTAIYAGLTGGTGASVNLLSVNEDYFIRYFTRETVDGLEIPRDFKYSIFGNGTDTIFAETLFRGAKVLIKDRSEFSEINYNVESLRFLANPKYNGYKFSAVLTYGDSGSQITFIKNDKWKAVTAVIQADINDSLLLEANGASGPSGPYKFIDRSTLYTLTHKLGPSGSTAPYDLEYTNINISGQIFRWDWDSANNKWIVYARADQNGNLPDFASEISVNENGGYNNLVSTFLSFSVIFSGISNISASVFECSTISFTGGIPTPLGGNTNNNLLIGQNPSLIIPFGTGQSAIPNAWITNSNYSSTWALAVTAPIVYLNGGYNGYSFVMSSISFGSIANSINSGEPEVRYINVDESGNVTANQYYIELARPDYPSKATYLKPIAIKKRPVELQNSAGIIGYELSLNDDRKVEINQIARYRGAYNPKWKDLIKFVDTNDIKGYVDVNGDSLEYNNIQLYLDPSTFKLKNLYYNKVNVESPNIILRFSESLERTIFPLLDEVAIDHKDLFLFKSNWDSQYFDKYLKANLKVPQIGTREPKEVRSFFGSKTIAIPSIVKIETFPDGVISRPDIGTLSKIKSVPENIVRQEIIKGQNRYLDLRIYTTMALSSYLINDGISNEFIKFINPEYSFGNPNQEDDVATYIAENIYDRYIVREVILWQKFWKKGDPHPDIEVNLTDAEKVAKGYVKTRNFQTAFQSPDDLDFQLIYNIPQDRNYSIAFTVVLEKK